VHIPRIFFTLLVILCIIPALNAQYVRINDIDTASPNGGMAAPTVLKSTVPMYTDDARTHSIEGTVVVGALMGEDGQIKTMRVLKGLGYGLDEMALSSIQQWTFSPATRLGTPTSVYAQVDVPFILDAANALRMGPGMIRPSPQYRVQPQCTDAADRAGYQGTVAVQLLVKKDGTVAILRVIQGLGLGLTDNAMDALKQWKFNPGQKDGQAADIVVNPEVNFICRRK
jgi:TonB family protein